MSKYAIEWLKSSYCNYDNVRNWFLVKVLSKNEKFLWGWRFHFLRKNNYFRLFLIKLWPKTQEKNVALIVYYNDLLYEKFWYGTQRELIECTVVDRLLRNAIEIRPYWWAIFKIDAMIVNLLQPTRWQARWVILKSSGGKSMWCE